MNKTTAKTTKKNPHKQIQQWITRLEEQARALLDGINVEEMTAKERFDVAMKVINTMQRFISLDQQIESATPAGGLQVMMAALMRQISGDHSDQETTTFV